MKFLKAEKNRRCVCPTGRCACAVWRSGNDYVVIRVAGEAQSKRLEMAKKVIDARDSVPRTTNNLTLFKAMNTEKVFALLVAVLAPCLATLSQPAVTPAALTPTAPVVPPLVGPDSSFTNAPAGNEVVDVVAFDGVALPDAIRTLALQAGLNIEFDPRLLSGVGPSMAGRVSPPVITEKWKKVTAMQALQALLDNWGWQLQWDPRTSIARVTAKDPAALEPLVVAVVPLRYSEPSNIVVEIAGTLSSRSTIVQDKRTRQLVIRTTEKELPGVEALITQLDTATRQVLIEAKIVETTKDITSAKGIDWTGTLANPTFQFWQWFDWWKREFDHANRNAEWRWGNNDAAGEHYRADTRLRIVNDIFQPYKPYDNDSRQPRRQAAGFPPIPRKGSALPLHFLMRMAFRRCFRF